MGRLMNRAIRQPDPPHPPTVESPAEPHKPPRSRIKITFAGLLYLLIMILVGLAALSSETNLLFAIFGLSLGAWLFSAIVPALIVRRLEVERSAPQAVVADRDFHLVYTVRHRRGWGRAWSVTVRELPAGPRPLMSAEEWFFCLSAGEQLRIESLCRCPLRGRVRLQGVRLETRFPLGLFCCSVEASIPAEMVVYPAVGKLRRDPWRGRQFSSAATRRQRDVEQEDFYGIREYQHGDNPRSIHWRRSARTGQLVVRENASERTTQVVVLLDPWSEQIESAVTAAPASRLEPALAVIDAQVEQVIVAAATALCDALERGHRAALIARGLRSAVIAPAGGRAHRQRLMHELALLEPASPETLDELIARIRWTSGWNARCLLCTTRLTASHQKVLRFLRPRAEAVVVVTPGTAWLANCFQSPPRNG